MDKPIIAGDTITIPSSQDFLSDVDLFVEGTLRGYGAGESVIADIAISVSELVNNAIIHGNRMNASKKVRVECEILPGWLMVIVEDQGRGFKPEAVGNPLKKENLLKESGRGIFLMRTLMDKVEFESNRTGTQVRLWLDLGKQATV